MVDNWGNESLDTFDDYELDGSEVDGDDLVGGDQVDQEGWYHLEIADVVPELDTVSDSGREKTPAVRFDCVVMQSVKGQSPQGSRLFHRIYVAGKGGGPPADGAIKSALRFGLGVGLLKQIEQDGKKITVDAVTNSPKINSETWKRAKGLHFVAKVNKEVDEKYGDKFQIPFGRCYRPSDPAVAKVPKNKEALAMAESAPASQAEQPPQAAHAASDMDDLADL